MDTPCCPPAAGDVVVAESWEGRPLLVYDGDCGICRRWARHWQRVTGERVAYAPFQTVAARLPQIPLPEFQRAVQLIEPDGRVSHGARAVIRLLAHAPGKEWLVWVTTHVPGVATLLEWGYQWIAVHRDALAWVTRLLWGSHVGPSSYRVTRWVFFQGLAIVYLIAFISLWTQIHGLVGSYGISPASRFLEALWERFGASSLWMAPTLCWITAGDAMLTALCGLGTALAFLLILGIAPAACLTGLWATYLSLTVVGQEFLSFQWDILLLETGFLAIWFAPLKGWPGPVTREAPPSPLALWLLRWLLFRLMVSSGVVKLVSGDPTWWNLTALTYHYETQPLPTWIGWYVHQLPAWAHIASCAAMLATELAVPFLIFTPRRPRIIGGAILIGLQGVITATGNYTFFNLLTVVLCLLLLDDAAWPRRLREILTRELPHHPSAAQGAAQGASPPAMRQVVGPVAAILFSISLVPLTGTFTRRLGPEVLVPWYRVVSPWHLVNPYGLFAVMTTDRPEIVVEGSLDGVTWKPYEFQFKPGDPTHAPGFVAPHQPRLDWQMWFAALGSYQTNPWFLRFCERLLQGTPEVLELLAKNPFPDHPPRLIRAVLYNYRFTDWATRREQGAWWRRERLGLYCPPLSLRDS